MEGFKQDLEGRLENATCKKVYPLWTYIPSEER